MAQQILVAVVVEVQVVQEDTVLVLAVVVYQELLLLDTKGKLKCQFN
jgi:hypothetical protein